MPPPTDAERLATLEAHRGAHEDRHDRFEAALEKRLDSISSQISTLQESVEGRNRKQSLVAYGGGAGGLMAVVYVVYEALKAYQG